MTVICVCCSAAFLEPLRRGGPVRKYCPSCRSSGKARAWYSRHRREKDPAVREAAREALRRWRRENKDRDCERNRRGHLKRTYGITLEDYTSMLARQGGGCAVCGRKPDAGEVLSVDHNHKTGTVRGVLCRVCNQAAGLIETCGVRFEKIEEYLRRTAC